MLSHMPTDPIGLVNDAKSVRTFVFIKNEFRDYSGGCRVWRLLTVALGN